MPLPQKTGRTTVFMSKVESTYGTYTAPASATDARELALSDRYQGLPKKGWLYDGMVGDNPANTAPLPRIAKAAPFFDLAAPFRFRGAGAAYSASVKAYIHDQLLSSWLTGAFSGGAGSEKWTFTPTTDSATPTSLSIDYYHGGQRYQGTGAVCTHGYEWQQGAPPLFTFGYKMIQQADVSDAAAPAPTYPLTGVIPPGSFGGTFTIGSFLTAAIRSAKFDYNVKMDTPRPNYNGATAHLGYVFGAVDPKLTLVFERTAFVGTPFHTSAGIDYYKLAEAATQIGCVTQLGSVQYNRLKHNLYNAQIGDVDEQNDGPVKTVSITWEPKATTSGLYDWMDYVAD